MILWKQQLQFCYRNISISEQLSQKQDFVDATRVIMKAMTTPQSTAASIRYGKYRVRHM